MTTLSVIILTFNSEKYISKCLQSILEVARIQLDAGEAEVVVYDNNSSDDTVNNAKSFVKKNNTKNINIHKDDQNLGFSTGINKATRHAKGEYLLFLNPDTEIENDKIFDMIREFDHGEKVAVVGGKVKDFNDHDELSAGRFLTLGNLFFMTVGLEKISGLRFSPQRSMDVDFVSGGFMMVKKVLFEKLGGFDEKIFMYVEDMEFCYRLKQQGFRILFFPNAIIKHLGQGSSNRQFAIQNIYKGILYFYKKHRSSTEYNIAKLLLISKAKIAIMVGSTMKKPALTQTYVKAIQTIQ